jgi:hypothetical protein
MNTFCTCTAEEISIKGFSMRQGVAYCNNCLKPDESTSPSASPSQGLTDEIRGNAIADLFDFKLEKFVSVTYFRFLYAITVVLWTIVLVFSFVVILVSASTIPGWVTVLLLLGSPFVYLLAIIISRMSIELTVNFFQIGRDIKTLSQRE